MLDLGGIPLRAADRGEDDPLVIAGGPTATHPEPITAFLDAVLVGDGEERTTEVALAWTEMKDRGVPRAARLRELSRLRGVYVPSLYEIRVDADTGFEVVDRAIVPEAPLPVRRSLVEDLNRFPFPDDGPVGGPEAIFDRMSIEIARGCTEGCRFCQAGMIYRPVRERDPEQIVDTLVAAVKKSGYDEVSLTSLSTADFSCIAPLIKKVVDKLAPENVSLGVSSLRAYGLGEDVLDDLQRVRATGVTFAPEAGSQRMRDVVNKNVTEEQLMTTAERIFSRGWDRMKLYFMIGLPTEEESDVREIVKVGKRARDVGKRVKSGNGAPKVTVSVSTHVPKPHTPFQWCAMDPADQVREKQAWLKDESRSAKVDLRMHDSETSWLEGVFARGDRKLCNVLERAYRAGARFDSWEDQLKITLWTDAMLAEGLEPSMYLGTIPVTARLPWDHIDVGLEEGFLAREYRKALKNRLSPPCGKVAGAFIHATNLEEAEKETRRLVCYDCGVACDLGAMREERLVALRKLGAEKPRTPNARPAEIAAELAAKRAEKDAQSAAKAAIATRIADDARDARVTTMRAEGADASAIRNGWLPMPPRARRSYRRPSRKSGPIRPPRARCREACATGSFTRKLGPSAFLSHLDLIRALPRAFRRLGVPLHYTGGFHPKPNMTFGPALSLGVASLGELVDFKLSALVDVDELTAALTRSSPSGLEFVSGALLGEEDPPGVTHHRYRALRRRSRRERPRSRDGTRRPCCVAPRSTRCRARGTRGVRRPPHRRDRQAGQRARVLARRDGRQRPGAGCAGKGGILREFRTDRGRPRNSRRRCGEDRRVRRGAGGPRARRRSSVSRPSASRWARGETTRPRPSPTLPRSASSLAKDHAPPVAAIAADA